MIPCKQGDVPCEHHFKHHFKDKSKLQKSSLELSGKHEIQWKPILHSFPRELQNLQRKKKLFFGTSFYFKRKRQPFLRWFSLKKKKFTKLEHHILVWKAFLFLPSKKSTPRMFMYVQTEQRPFCCMNKIYSDSIFYLETRANEVDLSTGTVFMRNLEGVIAG